MPSEIAIPFRIGGDGRVVTVSDPDAQVRQHVHALINTPPTERLMVPGYGVALNELLFEPNFQEEVSTEAGVMISDAFATWEPGVELTGVVADPDSEGNLSIVNVGYARRDAADSGTVANANEAIISANGVVQEIVRG